MIIKTNIDEIESYLTDAANYKGSCSSVYFPENVDDIQNILLEANKTRTPVTIAGNRTGITGGAIPEGGIVISTEKLNKRVSLKDEKLTVECGAILQDILDYVESQGLYYPPDPTEKNCFIGGNIATNASGAKTLKYGPTRNFVSSLKVVLPQGDILSVRRGNIFAKDGVLRFSSDNNDYFINLPEYNMPSTKHAAGYYIKPDMDLIDLFIGSEGTLGIITEAELKLLTLPDKVISSVIFFPKEDDALSFIMESDTFNSQIIPSGMEFFDKYALNFLRFEFPNIPENVEAAVWFEQDKVDNIDTDLDKWLEFIERHNGDIERSWIATNEKERNNFKDIRHAVSWKVNEQMARKGLRKVGTDTAVPKDKFLEFYRFIRKTADESGIEYLIYGHFGNHHPHLNLLPKDEKEFREAKALYAIICKKAVDLGGTISAEHGIGKMKHNYLLDMFGEEHVKQMATVKRTLDPNGVLGVGNIFDKKYLAV